MALRIRTDLPVEARRELAAADARARRSLFRPSRGPRLTSAGDDAGGLQVAEHLRARARSLVDAARDVELALGLVETAESALVEIQSLRARWKSLEVRMASAAVSTAERRTMRGEILAIVRQIRLLLRSTAFAGEPLFTSDRTLSIPVGADADTKVEVRLRDLLGDDPAPGAPPALRPEDAPGVGDHRNEAQALRSELAAARGRLEGARHAIGGLRAGLLAPASRIDDADLARASAAATSARVRYAAGLALLVQANAAPDVVRALFEADGAFRAGA